jgi:tetratricopeptide (TPR) repeat protein
MYQKDYASAIELGKLGVYWMGKAGNHSLSYRFKFDLACILLQSGDVEQALEMHEEILEVRTYNICGKNNVFTLQSCYAVAVLYERLGRLEEAEYVIPLVFHFRGSRITRRKLFKSTLDRRRAADWSEEAVARTKYCLSRVLTRRGRELEKAERYYSVAKEVLNRLLPLDMQEWLEGEDEEVLFDHLLDSANRFTGQALLRRLQTYDKSNKRSWAPDFVTVAGITAKKEEDKEV